MVHGRREKGFAAAGKTILRLIGNDITVDGKDIAAAGKDVAAVGKYVTAAGIGRLSFDRPNLVVPLALPWKFLKNNNKCEDQMQREKNNYTLQ